MNEDVSPHTQQTATPRSDNPALETRIAANMSQRFKDEKQKFSAALPLVNIILVFGRNNDRNVQCFVNGRLCDRLWTYLCISSNLFGPKTS